MLRREVPASAGQGPGENPALPGPLTTSRQLQPCPDPIRVLVVDDVASVREVVSVVLETEDGFVVVGQASDGNEAVAQVRRLRPHAVVLDLTMPVCDGLTAIPRLREVGGPDLRICVFSGQDELSTVETAAGVGADAVLTKGSAVLELPQRLRSLWA